MREMSNVRAEGLNYKPKNLNYKICVWAYKERERRTHRELERDREKGINRERRKKETERDT
jgi:hypothetical protein